MRFAWLGILLLGSISVNAQQLTALQKAEMVYCAVHGGGGWIGPSLYPGGKVRFNHVLEQALDVSDEKDPRDIYVAFWNVDHSAGELLVFYFFKTTHGKDFFILNNNGHIVNQRGHLVVDDALGGVYTYRKLQRMLLRLRHKAVTNLAVARAKPGSSICKTPLDLHDSKNWER